jgi:hypothetical protein
MSTPFVHHGFADIDRNGSSANGIVLIGYRLCSFKAKQEAKIASVMSGHDVKGFDYEVMISPLIRWPNLLFH